MSLDDFWAELWSSAPTQAEVDAACNKVTVDAVAEARAAHPSWSKDLSDVTVRALLVLAAIGQRYPNAVPGRRASVPVSVATSDDAQRHQ